jgi:hypothetical protein
MLIKEIIAIAEKHGIDLYHPAMLTDMGDGTSRFIKSTELTYYGEKILLFAKELLEKNK